MLHDVVWGKSGTARKWVQDENVEIAGKTGTAYTVRNDGTYGEEKRLAFCGFFPYKNPKYSCVVLMLRANRGAAASSGVVLKNIAAKMYARGLLGANSNLDNSSTPKRDVTSHTQYESTPILYANMPRCRINDIKNFASTGKVKVINTPANSSAGVPNVSGMSIREAVYCLEKVGLNVRFNGWGRVVKQSLPAGSAFNRGALITLSLSS